MRDDLRALIVCKWLTVRLVLSPFTSADVVSLLSRGESMEGAYQRCIREVEERRLALHVQRLFMRRITFRGA